MIIHVPFWLLLLVVVPYWIHKCRQSPARDRRRELLLHVLFLYGLAVTYVTQFPLRIWTSATRTFNWMPFSELYWLTVNPRIGFINIAGNIVMFIPLGFIVPLLYRRYDSLARITALGFLCSAAIEFIQFLSASRQADIDDLLLNTLGAVLGYGLLKAVRGLGIRILG